MSISLSEGRELHLAWSHDRSFRVDLTVVRCARSGVLRKRRIWRKRSHRAFIACFTALCDTGDFDFAHLDLIILETQHCFVFHLDL
jgi:hypothetical protein